MKTTRISMKDIAKRLGVSNATVSLVLNGKEKKGRVSKELAEKIKVTAKEMNYQPNNIARSLRMGYSQTIGLIIADISNTFFSNLAFFIQEEAEKYGYTVIITNTNENVDKMQAMISMFRNRQVDGFLIVPTENSEICIQELVDNNIPLVLIDRYFPFIQTSYVVIDNYQASLDATKLLIENDCKKIAFVTYKNKLSHILERRSGFLDALAYAGKTDNVCIKEVRYSHIDEDIDCAINELFEQESGVDGIFFATNSISMIGMKKMSKRGIDFARKVKIVCFDKNDAFDLIPVTIPYVSQPVEEIGKNAVSSLIAQMESPKNEARVIKALKLQASLRR